LREREREREREATIKHTSRWESSSDHGDADARTRTSSTVHVSERLEFVEGGECPEVTVERVETQAAGKHLGEGLLSAGVGAVLQVLLPQLDVAGEPLQHAREDEVHVATAREVAHGGLLEA
jgi:hypothetical protein